MNPQDENDWLAAQFSGEALLANPPKGLEDRILSEITVQMAAGQPMSTPESAASASGWSLPSIWLKCIIASALVGSAAALYYQDAPNTAVPVIDTRAEDGPAGPLPTQRRSGSPSMADETPGASASASMRGQLVASLQTTKRTTPSAWAAPQNRKRPTKAKRRQKARASRPRATHQSPSTESNAPATTAVVQPPAPAQSPPRSPVSANTQPIPESAKLEAAPRDLALRAERTLLSLAVNAIRASDLQRARRVLTAYITRFPAGQLDPEYRLVRIRLHLANGRPDAARAAARAFMKRYPSSGLRQTIERLVK